ncbi:uncharacterized protein LOC143919210 [Arctopsyche grandis]|uniref:uncharacterized protein LOC143919210 n=1 Tax=Arctopsyche grandis TaxID=121162 RepID=UPI00406D80DA
MLRSNRETSSSIVLGTPNWEQYRLSPIDDGYDTEIEYFPLSPTLTRIRVHKNASNDILCYPITSTVTDVELFSKYQQAPLPSFISLDYPKATKYDPPAPPRRLSSKVNSTLKLVSSIPSSTNTLQTNVKYIQNKLSNKSANPPQKENRKKEVRETKMKSADGKRIKITRATVPISSTSSKVKTGTKSLSTKRIINEKCTSSFSSPRRTMSPVDYASANLNKLYSENLIYNREVIEGGAGRRTPISGILDRGASLDRTFASEKRNLPLKSIQEYPNKALSKSTETIILSDNGITKEKRSNAAPIKKSLLSYSSLKNGGRLSDDKRLKAPMSISARGRELMRTSDKLINPNSTPIHKKISQSYSSLPLKKSSSVTRQRKSLEDITSKVKSSNSSLNSIKSSKSVSKTSKTHEACKSSSKFKDNQFGDFKTDKSNGSKTSKKTSKENDRKQSIVKNKSQSGSGVKSSKSLDKATLQYIKSVNREIDSYVSQYENNPIVNYNEIMDQRDAVMSDSFFQHLLLRGVPPQTPIEPDDSYYSTSVLEKAKLFQNGHEPWPLTNRPVNSYLSHKKPVTDSKFRTWDRYERSRPRSPRAVSWPGRMSQSCIKKFDSLSNRSINDVGTSLIFPKADNRSRSEPPLPKMVFSQTTRPRSPVVTRHIKLSESPKKIVYQRTHSPPAKMIFSQTSRPLSPVIVHTKKRKIPEPAIRLPSPSKIVLTETSRPVTPTFNKRRLKEPEEIQFIRSRSESPVLAYYSDSEPMRKRASPAKYINVKSPRKIREESPSPSPMRSPSCRRIHSARISQCKAEDCISGLKKKIIRTHSAGDAEAKEKPDTSFVRSSSFLNLDHIKNHLDYQEYITEMKHRKNKSDRFKELHRFYAYLERIGELERTTSTSDLRPRRRFEEIIDFDRWKRVRAMERAEEELDRLYKKMKVEQQEKDLLFLPHDAESLRWSQYKDWNLRIKEKSVEDLRDHFTKLADNESDRHDYYKKESDFQRDTYKPLWRGNSVVNLASSLTKRSPYDNVEKIERSVFKPKVEPTLSNIKERLGIGSRLWSSLSMEQVSALKNQLNSIYSKDSDLKPKEIDEVNEDYIITVPDVKTEKSKSGLQVRCNSFTVGDVVNAMEPNKNIKADSISSIQNFPMDKDLKNSLNTYQNLSERDKKRISMTLSQEILERVKHGREKYSPVVLAKETRGATAASRIRGIAKNQSDSPRACYSEDVSEDEKSNDFALVLAPNNQAEEIKRSINEWSEGRAKDDKKNDESPSPLHPSSASETETGSSDASNRTVIFRGSKDEVQKKVEYFERSKDESSTGTIIYHARDDSFEDNKHDKETKPSKLSHSQSYSSLKEIFGETQMNNYASLSPLPKTQNKPPKITQKLETTNTAISSIVSSTDNICRSRSLSPDPERYWRAYLSLVKAGEVQKLKKKFEFKDDYMYDFEESLPKLRRHQSDPEIIRTILQHNWNKKKLVNVKRHERGDVDRLTHKYETSSRGRSRYRRHGIASPIPKNPLRVEDRDMPHIDVISKIASLKPDTLAHPITGEYPIECPIGEVHKIRQQFEDTSLLGKMFTSTPDIHELRDIAPYLSGPWVAHKYPKRKDNNRSLSTSDYITEDKYSPVRKDRPRPKSTSPIRPPKPSSILKQGNNAKTVDIFADQEFDPVKHRPRYRYLPPRDEPPARPAFPHQLQQHPPSRPTVTFQGFRSHIYLRAQILHYIHTHRVPCVFFMH